MKLDELVGCSGFDWDEGNSEKNWVRHHVTRSECEQIFYHRPLVVSDDPNHSQAENRYYALGKTDTGRRLFVVFTVRGSLLRVISARNMSRRERGIYDKESNPEVSK